MYFIGSVLPEDGLGQPVSIQCLSQLLVSNKRQARLSFIHENDNAEAALRSCEDIIGDT